MQKNNIWTPAAFSAVDIYNRSDSEANDWTHFGDQGNSILATPGALTVTRLRIK